MARGKPEKLLEEEDEEALEKAREQARLEAERAALEAARKRVDGMLQGADIFLEQRYWRDAIPKYNEVLLEAEKINYREALFEALKRMARCYFNVGYFEVACGYMERAAGMSVLSRTEENFLETIRRKLWDKEEKRKRAEGF